MSFTVYGDLPEYIIKKAKRIADESKILNGADVDIVITGRIMDDRMMNLLDQLLTERAELEGIEV